MNLLEMFKQLSNEDKQEFIKEILSVVIKQNGKNYELVISQFSHLHIK